MLPHRIPKETMKDVANVVTHVEAYLPTPPQKYIIYLFEIYNQYVNPLYKEDEDINCGGCRSLVISKLRTIVRTWKEKEMNSKK